MKLVFYAFSDDGQSISITLCHSILAHSYLANVYQLYNRGLDEVNSSQTIEPNTQIHRKYLKS